MEALFAVPVDFLVLGDRVIEKPAFIVGCARSGTSILGEAIAAHPDVAYLFEASVIWNALQPDRVDDRLTATDLTPEIADAARRALAQAGAGMSGHRLLEKNPKHVLRLPYLAAIFPDCQFIHIIRDGRDTVASLMFRNRGAAWGHLKTPGWQELLARYPREHHLRCAHQWRDAVTIARQDAVTLALGKTRYHELRYEDLLRDPGEALHRVLDFIGLQPHPLVDAFLPRIQDSTERSYHAKRQVRHYVENHSRRVGRHLENLTPAELAEVTGVCGGLLAELGYQLESKPSSPGKICSLPDTSDRA